MNLRTIVSTLLSIGLSLLVAFFGVFNVLFSDHNGPRDAEVAVGFVLLLYLVTSVIIHAVQREPGWKWFWWLVVPAVVLGGGFSWRDQGWKDWYTWTILGTMILAVAIGRLVTHLGRSKPGGKNTP